MQEKCLISWRQTTGACRQTIYKKPMRSIEQDFVMVSSALPPKIKNIDKLLAHCQRRRYAAKSSIICAGDQAEDAVVHRQGLGDHPDRG